MIKQYKKAKKFESKILSRLPRFDTKTNDPIDWHVVAGYSVLKASEDGKIRRKIFIPKAKAYGIIYKDDSIDPFDRGDLVNGVVLHIANITNSSYNPYKIDTYELISDYFDYDEFGYISYSKLHKIAKERYVPHKIQNACKICDANHITKKHKNIPYRKLNKIIKKYGSCK